MRLSSIFSAVAALALTAVSASNVVDLDSDNFDLIIGQGKPALVEFFAPWCGHCKTLAPIYEQLADAFSGPISQGKLLIAKTDADGAGKELGGRYGVRGFPTLKWFGADDTESPEDYEGGRDLETLVKFISTKTGLKSSIKPPPPSLITELGSHDFDEYVGKDKDVLVAFTAPWCGHCKSLKPIYEKVASDFKNDRGVVVAQVNADAAENKPLANEYGVQGFPTIKFFPRGSKAAVDYNGARSQEALTEYLNENAGTFRAVGGRLLASAGKVLSLDKLASRFYSAATPERPEILKQAQAYIASLAGSTSDTAKRTAKTETTTEYYLKAMQRISEKGEGWVEKETARIGKLLQSASLGPEKLDELQTKNNILSSFAHRVYDEAADALSNVGDALSDASLDDVEDAVRHATASAKTIAAQATGRVKAEL